MSSDCYYIREAQERQEEAQRSHMLRILRRLRVALSLSSSSSSSLSSSSSPSSAHVLSSAAGFTTQFTCFLSTIVQILTPETLGRTPCPPLAPRSQAPVPARMQGGGG